MASQRQVKSYLYDYINYKYINNSKSVNFKQKYLKLIKQKSSTEEIQEFIEKEFFNQILEFFNDKGKQVIATKITNDFLKNLIKKFEKKVGNNFVFRYYQYLSVLNTYFIFLIIDDKNFQDDFVKGFKEYLKNYDIELSLKEFDLRRLNYWMATGSGKTYLMYFILELYIEIFYKSKNKNLDNIFLIVPAGLREQHKKELYNIYKINFENHTQGSETTFTGSLYGTNLILTSTSGLSNIVSNKMINLDIGEHIFVYDEGHKGAGGDRNTEDIKKNIITNNNNFIFDYSATFQEVIKGEINNTKSSTIRTKTLNNYFTSSIYNYNLTFFQDDGYGKKIHYEFGNIRDDENIDDKEITKNNLKNALKKFNLQLKDYSNLAKENIEEKFYKPLFLGVSNEIGTGKSGEVQKNNLIDVIKKLVELYTDKDLVEVFGDSKNKVSFEIGTEEILITLGKVKGLIYTGSNGIKKVGDELLKIKQIVNISKTHIDGEFNLLDSRDDIIFLFGSKKFIEGWDSKRPSTIFLLKGAKTSTIQAIQLLGRGLRLSGYNFDGFRHNSKNDKINELEKLYLIGQDTNSLKGFLENSIDRSIKIIKYYKTTPKDGLNDLKLPYLKATEIEKSQNIKIKLATSNIKNNYIKILNQKIYFNNEYYKKSKKLIDGEIFTNDIDKNKDKINIPFLIMGNDFINIISDLNSDFNNKVIYDIDKTFLKGLYQKISFYENTGMSRKEQKDFIKSIIKNILNSIIYKLNKENSFEVKYIDNNDKDISFDYYVGLKHEKQDGNRVFGLELREDKKYSNIIEIRNNNFGEWFNLDENVDKELIDLKNELEKVENKYAKIGIENQIKQLESQKDNKLKNIFDKNFDDGGKKEHLYKRLYHFYSKESDGNEKDYDGFTILKNETNIKKEDIEISPSSILLLNNYEAEIINDIVDKYKNNYDEIHLFRNPPNGDKYFVYKNKEGGISKFYPDFIFWFIKDNKIDILYLDPKGNDEEKEGKTNCFKTLNKTFSKNTFKNLKLGNNAILGFGESYNEIEKLNNFSSVKINTRINSITGVIIIN